MTDQTPPPPPWQHPAPPGPSDASPQRGNGLATAGFVLSLVGLLGSWIPLLNILGIILGVLGAVLATIGLVRSKRVLVGKGLSIAGLVMGVLAVVVAVVVNVAFVGAVDDAVDDASAPAPKSTVGPAPSDSSASDADADGDEASFVDGVLTTADIEITITDHQVIQPGAKGNEYGDKPVILFTYDTTNLSGAQTDPSSAWIFAMKAYQDNNPDAENELDLAIVVGDDKYTATSSENIKKGGTVTNQQGYDLDDLTTPVDLKASELFGDSLGTVTYTLK